MLQEKISEMTAKTLSPLLAIRKYCLWCMGDDFQEIRLCPGNECVFFLYRLGKKMKGAPYSSLSAIKKKCHNCTGFNDIRVRKCNHQKDCSLWSFRMGHNPNRKGIGRKGGNPNIRNIHSTSEVQSQD